MSRKHSVYSPLDDILGQQISAGKRPRDARAWVDQALRASLPSHVPLSYRSIDRAQYISSQPKHEAIADVTMFDGLKGRVRVWRWARGTSWAHEWLECGGGTHCSYEDGRWVRIDPLTLEVLPTQYELLEPANA